MEVAANTDDVPFAITSNDDVFAEYKVEGEKVVLFKKVCCYFNCVQFIDRFLTCLIVNS